jgi:putative nucleotidyltransferase with HDIG domain
MNVRINTAFLRTKVARRVLALFVICALVPIGALAIVSYRTVSRQLYEQSRIRVHQAGKATADGLLERLHYMAAELGVIATALRDRGSDPRAVQLGDSVLGARIAWIGVEQDHRMTPLFGAGWSVPDLDEEAQQHLRSGNTLLTNGTGEFGASVFMARAVSTAKPELGTIWAEPNRDYLFAGRAGTALPADTELCAFDGSLTPLYCSIPVESEVLKGWRNSISPESRGEFEWSAGREQFVATYRSVFLRAEYATDSWTLVLSESKATVLAAMTGFKRLFLPVILLALWVVLLLSNIQIRRSMEPLVELQQGTQRIARRDFASRVVVHSGDEFEELATSFNSMAHRLGRQFGALTAINEIDRAVLSAFDTDVIVNTVLARTREVLACDGVGIGISSGDDSDPSWQLMAMDAATGNTVVQQTQPTVAELCELSECPDYLITNGARGPRSYLNIEPFIQRGLSHFLVLPVFLKQQVSGVICLAYSDQPEHDAEDLVQARQLADQVAVALSNTRLVEQLDELKLGALTAFARTIDAKSSWTAGHSERVTKMALALAREMGLSEEQIEVLHRGGLLHDIGKIGVPASILDKPARLDADELRVMQQHPEIGAQILTPIRAYANVTPIVLHHHEKWDGSGYPQGLAGTGIPFLARLIAVPDVFDAITSDRPYRSGMPHAAAVEMITGLAGEHFDVEIVTAFRSMMARRLSPRGHTATALAAEASI